MFEALANSQYDKLRGLVSDELLEKLTKYFDELPAEKRTDLVFSQEDFLFSKISNIDICKQDDQAYLRISLIHILTFGELKKLFDMSVADLIAE